MTSRRKRRDTAIRDKRSRQLIPVAADRVEPPPRRGASNTERDRGGSVAFVPSDITESEALEALRESGARFRNIFHNAATPTTVTLPNGHFLGVNRAFCEMLGYTVPELLAATVFELTHPDDREMTREVVRALVAREMPTFRTEKRYVHKLGHTVWSDTSVAVVSHLDGSVAYFIVQMHDITARKNAEEALRRLNAELEQRVADRTREVRTLTDAMLEIATSEQRRIGQELHDGTGQELTGLALFAGTLAHILEESPQRAAEGRTTWLLDEAELLQLRQTANRLAQGLVEAQRHVQQLSHGILPVHVEPEGLRSALEELAGMTNAQRKITCRFDSPLPVTVSDNATAAHLYRIAQEAVNNALRHSRADQIRISFLRIEDEIVLEVSDNGIGCDATVRKRAEAPPATRGVGLEIMSYRARMIGGVLQFVRRAEGGMLLRCSVPWRESR